MKKILFLGVLIFGFMAFSESETVKGAKKDFQEFKASMSTELDKTEKKIAELKEKAKSKGSDTQGKAIAELEKTRDELKISLEKAKVKGQNGWKDFKKKFANSVDSLNKKVQKSLED